MKLSDTQRRQILRGTYPRIGLEDDEKVEPCEITIAPQVWVEVMGVHRNRKTGNYLAYRVKDFRPRFMQRGQGYTHSIALAVANEDAEAVPVEYQQELTMKARLRSVENQQAEEMARRQFKSFADAARGVVLRRARVGIDPGPTLARMLRELESTEGDEAA